MPDGGFEVDLKVLEAHERELRALIAAMPDAAAAGDSLWNPQAFGVIGMFLAQTLNIWTDDAVEYVDKAKAAGDDMADRFAAMREGYANGDKDAAAMFDAIRARFDQAKP
ncbi:hypothetical protein [Actinokineospora enzanensis]|uniref:hypothetical protein n=1 Tax=Actinokineospora enzanensis TaxID=155975 RepID=UPI0003653926|nr:hypothetical protein [Actinokineospora enzanensis]